MKLFHQNIEPQPYDSVELVIVTPELGKFAITGAFQDVEPAYEQALKYDKPRRHAGKFALAGF